MFSSYYCYHIHKLCIPDKKLLRNFVVLEFWWKLRNSSTKACVQFLIKKIRVNVISPVWISMIWIVSNFLDIILTFIVLILASISMKTNPWIINEIRDKKIPPGQNLFSFVLNSLCAKFHPVLKICRIIPLIHPTRIKTYETNQGVLVYNS